MLLVIVSVFTGCIETDVTKIDGTIQNDTDQPVYVEFVNDVTGEAWHTGIKADNSKSHSVKPGKYSLVARFGTSSDFPDELIDTADLNLRATDSYYTIWITNSSLIAGSD